MKNVTYREYADESGKPRQHVEWDCFCGARNVADFIFATWVTCPSCKRQWSVGGWSKELRAYPPEKPAK